MPKPPPYKIIYNWDGDELQNHEIRYCMINDPFGVSDVSSAVWQRYLLLPNQVASDSHTVKSILETRNPQLACDMVLTYVELVIVY
ncbi:MAG: hypothetical protein VYA69_11140 [Gemmatimonadota bacterium]|nr:hypothetical protein [Gemmatimonadota bacterium]